MDSLNREKLIKYLTIMITMMVCTTRLSMAFGSACYITAIIIGLVLFYKDKTIVIDQEIKGYIMATMVFFLSLVPSIVFSPDILLSTKAFFNDFIYRFLVFILIVAFIKKREYVVNMVAAFMLATCVDCLVVVYQVVSKYGTAAFYTHRAWGFGSNPLTLAGVMIMLMPMVLVFIYDNSIDKKLKKISKALLVCIFAGLWGNRSRSSWLFIPITIIPVLWQYIRKNTKQLAVVFAVLAVIGGFFAFNPTYNQRITSIGNTETDGSNVARIELWKGSIKMFKDNNAFTGVGVGRWRQEYKQKYQPSTEAYGQPHAHNNAFKLLPEAGLLGILGYLYFCFYFLYNSFRNWCANTNPYDLVCFCVFLGYMILFGLIEVAIDNSSGMRIMWFLMACMLQLKLLDREDTKNEN